jgi:hypothetical protein
MTGISLYICTWQLPLTSQSHGSPFVDLKKLPKTNDRTIGENSPNLVAQGHIKSCQIFLGTVYQNVENTSNYHKIFLKATKYIK